MSDSRAARAREARQALVGGTVGGRYLLCAVIGHGGMGAVYEAEHIGLGKRVAVKMVDPEFAADERVFARFAREARLMSAVESPHIVTTLDSGTDHGRPYLVMELLRGEDLGERLRRTHRLPLPEALHVIAQVLKGLMKAHAAGVVHRDLKPDNVFLTKSDSDRLFVKIVDFGVSKIDRPRDATKPLTLTGRGTVLGTPFYMAPEQAQASPDVDARADLYSAGAILFECLAGRPPHTGETYQQVLLSICTREAPDLRAIDPSVPPEVAAFVARALASDPSQRFASAERMLARLHAIAPEEKRRVPLELGAETLVSPAFAPAPGAGGQGRTLAPAVAVRGGEGARAGGQARTLASGVAVRGGAGERTRALAAPSRERERAPSARAERVGGGRRVAILVATAALAMITGIVVTVGLVLLLGGSR